LISIVGGLVASLAYGISDFLGAFAAIRLRVIPTTTMSYAAAVVVLAAAVVATGGVWSPGVWFWGSVAGLCAVVGFVTFYAAMSRGPMSLVSPLIAVLSAAVPIAAAVLLGETLPALAWVGVALALVAAMLIASQPRGAAGRLALPTGILSALAGVSLGCSLIALDRAPAESGLIAALVEMGALIDNPAVRRVNFTGSTAVGRVIAARAAQTLTPVLLELGGKAPFLVLADADLEEAVRAAAFDSCMNQGQICMSTERIIVVDSVAAKASTLTAGRPDSPLGPTECGNLSTKR